MNLCFWLLIGAVVYRWLERFDGRQETVVDLRHRLDHCKRENGNSGREIHVGQTLGSWRD